MAHLAIRHHAVHGRTVVAFWFRGELRGHGQQSDYRPCCLWCWRAPLMEALRPLRHGICWDEPAGGRSAGGDLAIMDQLPDPLHTDAHGISSFVHAQHLHVIHVVPPVRKRLTTRKTYATSHSLRTLLD